MRIALISDIHGNLIALDAVLTDMARHGPFDEIIVAGDLAWSGPWPAETVDRVRALTATVIQGNTDAFFGRMPDETPFGKREGRFADQLQWMRDQLGAERLDYLANLPFAHRVIPKLGHDLLVVHANPWDCDRPITSTMEEIDLDALLMGEHGEPDWVALAFGHVHVPFQRRWRGRLLVDVASAGLPMDGDPRAVYAIMTWDGAIWRAAHHRVFYNTPVVAHQMRSSGLPRGKHFAERLMGARYAGPLQTSVALVE